mmetsp:Transcript_3208/g.19867  ORF Transcript_3208/g.19867 Transcript_3208/m.19867 type:complete len:234 (-) Transcript_3208:11-712(-)
MSCSSRVSGSYSTSASSVVSATVAFSTPRTPFSTLSRFDTQDEHVIPSTLNFAVVVPAYKDAFLRTLLSSASNPASSTVCTSSDSSTCSGSNTTSATSPKRETDAACTPGILRSTFSTLLVHDEHVIPCTDITAVLVVASFPFSGMADCVLFRLLDTSGCISCSGPSSSPLVSPTSSRSSVGWVFLLGTRAMPCFFPSPSTTFQNDSDRSDRRRRSYERQKLPRATGRMGSAT